MSGVFYFLFVYLCNMKKTVRITESDIKNLVGKVLNEQKVEGEKVALEKMNKMISDFKSGSCKPWYSSGYQFHLKCNDGTKYKINEFR